MLMLVTSVGLNIDMHYCQGELKTFNLFGKAKSCHQLAQMKHCSKAKKSCHAPKADMASQECKKDCCNNESIYAALDADLVQIQTTEYSDSDLSTISLKQVDTGNLPLVLKTSLHAQNYRPPPLIRDIPVLIQSFLL